MMKSTVKRLLAVAIGVLLSVATMRGQLPTLSSPNGQVKVALSQSGTQTQLVLSDANDTQLITVQLGLTTTDADFTQLVFDSATEPQHIAEDYIMLHGKKSHVVNEANGLTAVFHNAGDETMEVEIRAYNDGLTFRYVLPDEMGTTTRTFSGEQTTYDIPNNYHRWLQGYTPTYEGDFPYQATGGQQGAWGYPALFEQNGTFMLITEANPNRMYCSTHLDNSSSSNLYKLAYPYSWEGNNTGDVNSQWTGRWYSPWRVVICGQLKDIVESTLVEDVSDATTMTQLDFVQPGRAAWVYWAYNHGTKDFQICCQYVDLAVAMGWEYVLFDWEWDDMSNGGNLEDAVAYALSKGIKPLMWYNSGGAHNTVSSTPRDRMSTHASRVQEFQWLNSIGVVGVKIDFFESDKQNIMNYFLDILEDAADYNMMVNFHGCTIPRGWTRTYPHLMSTEAVLGAEQYNNAGYMTDNGARVNCLFPYTRNVVGPMDYTPVAFTNSQYPHTTTYAHELALSVAFESGIQHWADRPAGFYALPYEARRHMMEVPVQWDETRFVSGYPGESFVVARRHGEQWYVAGINGTNNARTESVSLDFLGEGNWAMTRLADGSGSTSFNINYTTVTAAAEVSVPVLAKGGFVLSFKRATTSVLTELIQRAEAALTEASSNVGTAPGQYDQESVSALQTALNQARSLGNDAAETQIAEAYTALSDALANLSKYNYTQGSCIEAPTGKTNITAQYLKESSGFARCDEPANMEYTRFGLLAAPWTVTDNICNQDGNSHGGFDSYGGGRSISIEKWEDGMPAIVNGTICQTTSTALPAGTYHLELPMTEIWDTLSDGEIVLQVVGGNDFLKGTVLASYDMKARDNGRNDNRLSTCEFTLSGNTQVTIGWLVNISADHSRRSMRINAIYLYQGSTNVSSIYLGNYENIERGDEPSSISYYRFGTPCNWTVENFSIDNGSDGVKQGIDNFPGYNCLQLGRWEESASQYNATQLADARLYQRVTLPAGKYFFGAKYHYIEPASIGDHAYLFAATDVPTSTATLENEAFAYAALKTADTNDSFRGIEFGLQEETEVVLGWMMDATLWHSEFRCREVTLLSWPLVELAPITYNIDNLQLYQYLREAAQMYERGISSVVPAYNSGVAVYTNPNSTPQQATQAIETIRTAIAASVSQYQKGVPATYGIFNPSFENLSAQGDTESSNSVRPPFGWTMTRNGTQVASGDGYWYWGAINADGDSYMDGGHVFGVWNGSNYGDIQLSQTLEGLKNGSWQLTARLMSNHTEQNNQARIFAANQSMLAGTANDYSGLPTDEVCSFSGEWSTSDSDMHQLMTIVTEVTDGTLTFGVRSNGFFKADDFRLTYLGLVGDVNNDGTISLADITSLVNMLLSGVTTSVGDVNRDGDVDFSDVTALVRIILH